MKLEGSSALMKSCRCFWKNAMGMQFPLLKNILRSIFTDLFSLEVLFFLISSKLVYSFLMAQPSSPLMIVSHELTIEISTASTSSPFKSFLSSFQNLLSFFLYEWKYTILSQFYFNFLFHFIFWKAWKGFFEEESEAEKKNESKEKREESDHHDYHHLIYCAPEEAVNDYPFLIWSLISEDVGTYPLFFYFGFLSFRYFFHFSATHQSLTISYWSYLNSLWFSLMIFHWIYWTIIFLLSFYSSKRMTVPQSSLFISFWFEVTFPKVIWRVLFYYLLFSLESQSFPTSSS
jgi:hypothetical protein